jgi:ethanolamine ammonia-lyase small subunit
MPPASGKTGAVATAEAAPDFAAMRRATPARLGVGRAGPRYTTAALLQLRADHARAIDAVITEVSPRWVKRSGLLEVRSRAATRQDFLLRPELGRMLLDEDARRLRRLSPNSTKSAKPSVLLCIGDGLSSTAVEANAAPLVRALSARLARKYRMLKSLFVRNARVRIQDHIGEILRPDLICMLIGERPGLVTAESLSAYLIYRPRLSSLEPDRTVISNIHRGGLKIREAAAQISSLIDDAIRLKASGARLAQMLAAEAGS